MLRAQRMIFQYSFGVNDPREFVLTLILGINGIFLSKFKPVASANTFLTMTRY
jgi:hypothetical protein